MLEGRHITVPSTLSIFRTFIIYFDLNAYLYKIIVLFCLKILKYEGDHGGARVVGVGTGLRVVIIVWKVGRSERS